MPGIEPHIENLEAWVGVGVRATVLMDQLKDVFGPTYDSVSAAIAKAGGRITGPAYAEYFGMPTDTVDVEIGFGVDRVLDVPGHDVRERPATRAVVATHIGPYDQLDESYAELMPWLEMEGVELTESMFEFYDSDPTDDPATLVTRLVFPLSHHTGP